MAWYPGAIKMELQPESDSQPAIDPTQFICHSIAAPWDERRIYEYWRDSTNLESHFGLDFDGSLGQFIGTETKADANYRANLRPNGTGAISIETASNLEHTDPWTVAQMRELIELGVWVHRTHGIPLRICRTHDDKGFGYHSLFPEWSVGGTACPGKARIKQFREIVFPGIVARANGSPAPTTPTEEDDMTPEQARQLKELHDLLTPYAGWDYRGKGATTDAYADLRAASAQATAAVKAIGTVGSKVDGLKAPTLTDAQVAALADKVAANPALADKIAELVADKLATRLAN
ncbi:N-acetylmuramoyl-L-alanine amidase [Streptomyces sp. NPDC056529]|uniref:peptidoglycan recognition protein family protein n=1 Tax=Streptomyces sp. NPDC056529 TaxID=3345855 RepID=UPI0036C24B30